MSVIKGTLSHPKYGKDDIVCATCGYGWNCIDGCWEPCSGDCGWYVKKIAQNYIEFGLIHGPVRVDILKIVRVKCVLLMK